MIVKLVTGVYQDGDTFYHEEFGALVRFPGMVKSDRDLNGARDARFALATHYPELAYFQEESEAES